MCIISRSLKVAQGLNVWEISFFKLYLVVVTFILSIWFPVLLSLDLVIYIVSFVVIVGFALYLMLWKQWNFYKKIFTKWFWIHIFDKMWMFDIAVFKITMVIAWLLLAKLFPILLTAHIAWYIAIACLFIGYYMHWIAHTKD